MQKTFQLTILGSSAAIPTSLRHTSAQLLQYHNKRFLLDCAEGTQMQLRRYKAPLMGIDHIFISHLHGDHYLGLAGLLFSYHLLGREKDLNVFSPPGLKKIIEMQFRVANLKPVYNTVFHEITKGGQRVYEDRYLTVDTMEMDHRIPCYGYLFREKDSNRNMIKTAIEKYGISIENIPGIKRGMDYVTPTGTVVPNDDITTAPLPPRSYAFCSDTRYTENFLEQVQGVDVMYHEATFLHDKAAIAREKTHTTTIQAATLAKKAGVGHLLLGHYSARYKELSLFEKEAREVFPNSSLLHEGDIIQVTSPEQDLP